MARKKAKRQQKSLRLSRGEVWEVGRRPLEAQITELNQRHEHPELLVAVQAQEGGGVVLAEVVSSQTPDTALTDFVERAMRQPHVGKPRCPEVIRVASETEANLLAALLADHGTALEVATTLTVIEAFLDELEATLGGISGDYRTEAAHAGEPLDETGLRALFRAAKGFYRDALWEAYGDEMMFELTLEPGSAAPQTRYGVLMGSMGEEFGLALFPTPDDLRQFYEVSIEHLKGLAPPDAPAQELPPMPEAAAPELLQIPTLTLNYASQQDLSPPLYQELKELRLPVANRSAFPLVICTGQGRMRLARTAELAEMYVALQAIRGWEKRIDDVADEDELDVPVTTEIKAVNGFVPAQTVQVVLRENPYAEAEDEMDEEVALDELKALFEALIEDASRQSPARGRKKAPTGKASPKRKPTTRSKPQDVDDENDEA